MFHNPILSAKMPEQTVKSSRVYGNDRFQIKMRVPLMGRSIEEAIEIFTAMFNLDFPLINVIEAYNTYPPVDDSIYIYIRCTGSEHYFPNYIFSP